MNFHKIFEGKWIIQWQTPSRLTFRILLELSLAMDSVRIRLLPFFLVIIFHNHFLQVLQATSDFIGLFNTALCDENLYDLLLNF